MFKRLLSIAALAATFAFNANADVLWESTDAEGVLVDWGQPCVALSADQVVDAIAPGDFIEVTTAGVTEGGWPQVALFAQFGGWPPLANEGVGGKEYPYVTSFPVTNELYAEISENGLSVSGNGAYVSEVELVKGDVEIGPNTVWFGNKACDWGQGVSLPASLFADVKVGDKLAFYVDGVGFQVLLGGWEGLNLPCYESPEGVTYEDGVATFTMLEKYAETNDYDGKELNVFELMKTNGVVMHGTVTVTRIDYIPATAEEEPTDVLATVEAMGLSLYGWEDYTNFAGKATYAVEVLNGDKLRVNAWAGVEGYDIIVAYDEDWNITELTPVYNGKEGTTYTSGYAYLYTGNGNEYLAAYLAEGYAGAGNEDGEGYVWFQGFLNGNEDDFVYYNIEWPAPAAVDNLNALVGAPTEVLFIMDCDLQVIYQAGKTSIVTDGTTNMLAYFEDAEIEANDIVKGGYQAMLSDEIGFDFIYALEPVEIEKGGEPVQPKEYTAEDATSTQSEWGYVCITGVELDEEAVELFNEGDAAVVVIDETNMFLVANGLEVDDLEIPAAGKYNIVGFWMPMPEIELMSRGEGAQFVLAPIDIYDAVVVTLDSFTALADIPAGEEFTVGCNTTVVYSDESGFTVLQDPDGNNAAVNLDGVQATDVIGAGWIGMAEESSMILIMNEDELEILPGYGKEIEPKEYDVYDIAGTQAPWQYVKILNVYLDEDAIEELQDGNAATEEMIIFNALNVDVEALTEGVYNITGFWKQGESVSVNEDTQAAWALVPVAFEVAPLVIEDFNALTDFPDNTKVQFGFEATVAANWADYIYMLYDGQNFMPYWNVSDIEGVYAVGDVMTAGAEALFVDGNNGFASIGDLPEVVATGAALPDPVRVEAEEFANVSNVPFGYFTLVDAAYSSYCLNFAGEELWIDFGYCPVSDGNYDATGFVKNTGDEFIFYAVKFDKPTGINGVGVDDNAAEYYNLQGVKVSKPAAGRAYIRVQNGKAVKVVK